MERRKVCLAQATMCRERAQIEPERYDYWISEARRWQKLADERVGRVALIYVVRDGGDASKHDRRH